MTSTIRYLIKILQADVRQNLIRINVYILQDNSITFLFLRPTLYVHTWLPTTSIFGSVNVVHIF